jgi:hypothetical protein
MRKGKNTIMIWEILTFEAEKRRIKTLPSMH